MGSDSFCNCGGAIGRVFQRTFKYKQALLRVSGHRVLASVRAMSIATASIAVIAGHLARRLSGCSVIAVLSVN